MLRNVKRTETAIEDSEISDKYERVKNRVEQLQVRIRNDGTHSDSDLIIEAIDDVKRYMKTLVGELKLKPIKDLLPIRIDILNERLSEVEKLANAIKVAQNNDDDGSLLAAYETIKHRIRYGAIPSSNLKSFLFKTIKKAASGNIELNTPEKFLCPITQVIMQDPVTAADGYNYERKAIVNWIESQESSNKAQRARSIKTNMPLENYDLTPNSVLKAEIGRYIKAYCKSIPENDLADNSEIPLLKQSYNHSLKMHAS